MRLDETMNSGLGVIQKRSEPAYRPPGTIAALGVFARRIAYAYLPVELTISRVELALAYGVPEQIENHRHAHMDIAPSFNFHDHFSFAAPRKLASNSQRAAGLGEAQAAALFERLFSRHKRVVAFAPGAPQGSAIRSGDYARKRTLDFPAATGEHVERTLPRFVTTESEESARRRGKTTTPRTPEIDSGWGSPLTPAPKSFTLPPAEVKRVTDEVIREIDHRIIARRERMGRR